VLNPYQRYQTGLSMRFIFPIRNDGKCACGCGQALSGMQRRWYSDECRINALMTFHVIKGDNSVIREALYQRDEGFCRECGVYSKDWEADHIIPVFQGGGACSLDNFQTLCKACHKEKTGSLNSIPNSCYVHTSSLNFIPSILDSLRAFNNRIGVNIERKAVLLFD